MLGHGYCINCVGGSLLNAMTNHVAALHFIIGVFIV